MKHAKKFMWFWKATKTLRKNVNRYKPLKHFHAILWKPLRFLKLLDHRWLGIMKGANWPLKNVIITSLKSEWTQALLSSQHIHFIWFIFIIIFICNEKTFIGRSHCDAIQNGSGQARCANMKSLYQCLIFFGSSSVYSFPCQYKVYPWPSIIFFVHENGVPLFSIHSKTISSKI